MNLLSIYLIIKGIMKKINCIKSNEYFISFFSFYYPTASSTVGLKIVVVTPAIKTHRSIIKKKRKKHNKTVLLAKPNLNIVEVIVYKALIDLDISNKKNFLSDLFVKRI